MWLVYLRFDDQGQVKKKKNDRDPVGERIEPNHRRLQPLPGEPRFGQIVVGQTLEYCRNTKHNALCANNRLLYSSRFCAHYVVWG